MSPNFSQQAGDFAVDAAIDTAADNMVKPMIDMVASHLPGGQAIEAMLTTEADQVLNNEINTEVNKGFGGIINDVEGTFRRDQ